MAFEEYPKAVQVDGITLIARDKEHEDSLLAGKGDPQVLAAAQAAADAAAAEAKRVADEAAQKAKDADQAAKDHAKTAKAPEAHKADAKGKHT